VKNSKITQTQYRKPKIEKKQSINRNQRRKKTQKHHILGTMQQSKLSFVSQIEEKTVEARYLDKGKVICEFSSEFPDSDDGDCGGVV